MFIKRIYPPDGPLSVLCFLTRRQYGQRLASSPDLYQYQTRRRVISLYLSVKNNNHTTAFFFCTPAMDVLQIVVAGSENRGKSTLVVVEGKEFKPPAR